MRSIVRAAGFIAIALASISFSSAQAAKCRSRKEIIHTQGREDCPRYYTDITGQEHGENYGIPPVLTPQQKRDQEKRRLETMIREKEARQKDTQAEIERIKKGGL